MPFLHLDERLCDNHDPVHAFNTVALRRLRRSWDRRARVWDHHGAPALQPVIEAVLGACNVQPGNHVVDLGCGTGQLSIPLARSGARVTAVDISEAMVDGLSKKAALDGLDNIVGVVSPVQAVDLAPGSVDLIVSNYALHHLRHRDKQALVSAAMRWLRPGGRLVIGDMMLGLGVSARDRAIIGSKLARLARKGPGGWWRIIKNVGRYTLRLREHPATMERWRRYLEDAGFSAVTVTPIVAEAAIVAGSKPDPVRGPA